MARPRWQMTTRSRFAAVLGLAALAVAVAQVALLTGPPSPLQLLVIEATGGTGPIALG